MIDASPRRLEQLSTLKRYHSQVAMVATDSSLRASYAIFLILSLLQLAFAQGPRITIDSGTYRGVATKPPGSTRTVNKFLSIPYAVPAERFATPSPQPSSKEEKAADKLPPACPQNGGTGFGATDIPESEDCLYLNVFTPASNLTSPDASGRTVMVWFFGGGMQFGTASVPTYDGTNLSANHDIIVVAPNYRTNGKYAELLATFSGLTVNSLRLSWRGSGGASIGA